MPPSSSTQTLPRHSVLFLLALALTLLTPSVLAGNGVLGSNCSATNNRLDHNTHAFIDDCDARGYCGGTNTCLPKQCRSDEFPFGFRPGELLPPMCGTGQYCPDEESGCLPVVPLGGICQLNRDDQCQPPPQPAPYPPNYRTRTTDQVGFNASSALVPHSLNSICLRGICTAANATLLSPCLTDAIVYVGYTPANVAFTNVVSRDNCIGPGLYCDATRQVCLEAKPDGEKCGGAKECASYNCNAQSICVAPPEAPLRVGAWGYAVVAVTIAITVVLLVVCLWKVHKSGSATKRAELDEYYKEQLAYRTSILSLQSAVQALPPLLAPPSHTNPHPYTKAPQPPLPHRSASKSHSHHSMRNPYDSGSGDQSVIFDEEDEDKYDRHSFEDEKEKYGGGWEPEPLRYGYEERRDRDCGRDRERDERYEGWEEVDLERERR